MQSGRRRFLGVALGAPAAVAVAVTGRVARAQTAQHATQAASNTGQRLLGGYIQPALARFHNAAHAIHHTLTQQKTTQKTTQQATQQATTTQQPAAHLTALAQELISAWPAVSVLRFGPLVADNRFERVFFWPDPRGVLARQIRPLLQTVGAVPHDLRTHSVAVQGLPALVVALGSGEDTQNTQAGQAARTLAAVIARNVLSIATALQDAWGVSANNAENNASNNSANNTPTAFARDFAYPDPANAFYRHDKEMLMEVVKALSAGLRFVGDMQLRAALGAGPEKARPLVLPFGRTSRYADAHLLESIRALAQWHAVAAFDREPGWLRQNLQGELQGCIALLHDAPASLSANMAHDPQAWQTLALVVLKLDNARRLVDEHLAPALGVGLGFNALDGD